MVFKQNTSGIKKNMPGNLPNPFGGLNSTDALNMMKPWYCTALENWLPRPDGIVTRDGYTSWGTGSANPVLRAHVFASNTGAEKLFACTNSGVYDTTSAGAWPAASIALTNGKLNGVNFSTGAGTNFFLGVNGTDSLVKYDGTTWSSVATLGTATNLYSAIEVYRQRVFFIKKNSLEIEYLAVNSIGGIAVNYPLGALFRKGGYLLAIATWTVDSGIGPDDKLCCFSSKGEVAVFSGSDPSSATTWSLQGVYYIGRPISAQGVFKWGGDLYIITETGFQAMSKIVQTPAQDSLTKVTELIRPTIIALANASFPTDGWCVEANPLSPYILINVPTTPAKQLVMHAQTGAWTTLTGYNANCFARMAGDMYFGHATGINKITGVTDNGANITATMYQAWNQLKFPRKKKIEEIKAYLSGASRFTYNIGIGNDFNDQKELSSLILNSASSAALWGSGVWGVSLWTASAGVPSQDWQTVPDDYSNWKALYLQVVTNSCQVKYLGADLLISPGGNF